MIVAPISFAILKEPCLRKKQVVISVILNVLQRIKLLLNSFFFPTYPKEAKGVQQVDVHNVVHFLTKTTWAQHYLE